MKKHPTFSLGIIIALTITLSDLISKWWIVENVMQPPHVIPVTSFFNIVMAWNKGVSFGMFSSDSPYNQWILAGLAFSIAIGLLVWLWRNEDKIIAVSLGLVIGGAFGNAIDRLHYGAVADFLDFYIGRYHWPAFNVADIAISCGAALLIFDSLFRKQESPKKDE
ncbi:MAG: signal peptidase II [Rhodospirillales bacterium]|nr:signal peptidase II [Rhodospirillales bacterium]